MLNIKTKSVQNQLLTKSITPAQVIVGDISVVTLRRILNIKTNQRVRKPAHSETIMVECYECIGMNKAYR